LASPGRAEDAGAIQVELADGTNLLLRPWTFSYEYSISRRGETASLGNTARRDAKDLWSGKKPILMSGQTLIVQYNEEEREVDGERRKVPIARGFVIVGADGRKATVKPEPPHADLLVPDAGGRFVQARSVDLHGETMAGTRREFCLLSYTVLVECSGQPDQRVAKIRLQP
jgi:hypothetical protein